MVDNKSKTKAAMMQELESIKGLLLDDDEIPILQEVIDSHIKPGTPQPTISKRDLDELHSQFEVLSQTIAGKTATPTSPPPRQSVPDSRPTAKPELKPGNHSQTSAGLLDAFTRASQHQPDNPKPSSPAVRQPSLFQEEAAEKTLEEIGDNINGQANEWATHNHAQLQESADEKNREAHALTDFDNLNQSPADAFHHLQRTPLAKASGENPFLPQHIRARLHGNNPPPLFDLSASKNLPLGASKISDQPKASVRMEETARDVLIKQVIAAVLPQAEKELRQRLHELSQEELQQLLDQST